MDGDDTVFRMLRVEGGQVPATARRAIEGVLP